MEFRDALRSVEELFVLEFTIFNLSLVYIGMLFAYGLDLYKVFFITAAFLTARPAGLLINRYIGRDLDVKNRKKRGMASLKIPKGYLLLVAFAFSVLFIFCAYILNPLALALSPLVLALFVIDPISKRHTKNRHFVVGFIEGGSVIAGYIGAAGAFPPFAALYVLWAAIVFVGGGGDMLFTIIHVDFDRKNNLRTYPSRYGAEKTLSYSLLFHSIGGLLIILFGYLSGSLIILGGSFLAAAALMLEHLKVDVKNDKKVWRKFALYNALTVIVLLFSVAVSKLAM
jgi:4-hydroxybenzoate polyprenyltransferase